MKVEIYAPYSTTTDGRKSRYDYLAAALAEEGHKVVLHITDFAHLQKEILVAPGIYSRSPNLTVVVHKSRTYSKHQGIRRILYERQFARSFMREIDPHSDLLLRGPIFFVGDILLHRKKRYGRRIIVDVIDMWPEVFAYSLDSLPSFISEGIISMLKGFRNRMLRKADIITTVSEYYTTYFVKNIKNIKCYTIYWGHEVQIPNTLFLEGQDEKSKILYAGTIGDQYDPQSIIELIQRIKSRDDVIFYIAGAGSKTRAIMELSKEVSNVIYLGLLPAVEIYRLMSLCDIGLMLYARTSPVAMPIKFFDYLAHGLFIVNSLESEVHELVEKHKLGINFLAENKSDFIEKISVALDRIDTIRSDRLRRSKFAKQYHVENQYIKFNQIINELHSLQN